MKNCLKRSIVLLLLLTLCLTVNTAINTTPANAAANEIMVFLYPRPQDTNQSNWGKQALSFMGGWSQRAADNFSIYSNDYSGKIYYCIEPGEYIKTGDSYTEKDEFYWLTFPSNSTISSDKIKLHIGRIFQYGYIGNINVNWTSQSNADTLGNVIATQVLIWETVVGERDSEFNHVDPGASYDAVLDIVSPNHPIYSQIMKHYNRIVNAMQAHLDSPSFMVEEEDKAETVELRWNGTEYSASLTDTNNVLSHFDFEPDNSNVTLEKSGNKLLIKSKVAVNNVTLTAIRTLKRSGLITWSSSTRQDLATYSAEVSDPLQAFINIKTQRELVILKEDENGEAMPGVVFEIEKSTDGNAWTTIGQILTDENGKAHIENLIPDTYYRATEIQTQNGYTLLTEPIFEGKIKTADDPIITIKAINTPEFELPPTGGNSFLYIPITIALIMGAITTICYLIKKERGTKI